MHCRSIVFNISHQTVDEADMLDILRSNNFVMQGVTQTVGVFFKKKNLSLMVKQQAG